MYVAPGIGAVPTLFARVLPALPTAPAPSLPKPVATTTNMFQALIPRTVTVTAPPPPSPVLTPAARFAVTPTPVRPPAPAIVKGPATTTAMRPATPSVLTTSVLERVGIRPPAPPAVRLKPTSPFSVAISRAVDALTERVPTPTASPLPREELVRLKAQASRARVARPGSLAYRLLELSKREKKPLPRSVFGRLASRARIPRGLEPPSRVPSDVAPLIPAQAPPADSPFMTLPMLMPFEPEPELTPAPPSTFPTSEVLFDDDGPEPLFSGIDFDLALEPDPNSEVQDWLEGAENIAILERDPEDVPDELLAFATLSQGGDLSEREVRSLEAELAPKRVAPGPGGPGGAILAIAALGFALWVISRQKGPPKGARPFGGGKAYWN